MPVFDIDPGASPEAPGTLSFFKQGFDPSTGFQVTSEGATVINSMELNGATVNTPVLTTNAGTLDDRFILSAGGGMDWGGGDAATDTNLYRSGAALLRTDNMFMAAGIRLPQAEFTPQDHGLEAWSHDPYYPASSVIAVNGRIYAVKMPIRRAVTIDTLWWSVATAGATPTAGQNWVGLYSSAGARLAQTGVDGDISSTGGKATAITAQALTAGFVWQLFLFNAATAPTLVRGSSFESAPNLNLPTNGLRAAVVASGQTALPASFDPATLSSNGALTFFAGLEAA